MEIFQESRAERVTGCICGSAFHRRAHRALFSHSLSSTQKEFALPLSLSLATHFEEVFARIVAHSVTRFPFIRLDSRARTKDPWCIHVRVTDHTAGIADALEYHIVIPLALRSRVSANVSIPDCSSGIRCVPRSFAHVKTL